MKHTCYTPEQLFAAMYKGLAIEINARFNDIFYPEAYLKQFRYFRISHEVLVFTDKKTNSNKTEYYEGIFISTGNKRLDITKSKKLFKYLFPFISFRKDRYDVDKSNWYDINELLSKFPTRANIITELLKEL